jgi:hypothetical protein
MMLPHVGQVTQVGQTRNAKGILIVKFHEKWALPISLLYRL